MHCLEKIASFVEPHPTQKSEHGYCFDKLLQNHEMQISIARQLVLLLPDDYEALVAQKSFYNTFFTAAIAQHFSLKLYFIEDFSEPQILNLKTHIKNNKFILFETHLTLERRDEISFFQKYFHSEDIRLLSLISPTGLCKVNSSEVLSLWSY